MKIDDALAAVTAFHRQCGSPVADAPTLLDGDAEAARELATTLGALATQTMKIGLAGDVLLLRAGLALEELAEWLLAHADGDLPAAADAWAIGRTSFLVTPLRPGCLRARFSRPSTPPMPPSLRAPVAAGRP